MATGEVEVGVRRRGAAGAEKKGPLQSCLGGAGCWWGGGLRLGSGLQWHLKEVQAC